MSKNHIITFFLQALVIWLMPLRTQCRRGSTSKSTYTHQPCWKEFLYYVNGFWFGSFSLRSSMGISLTSRPMVGNRDKEWGVFRTRKRQADDYYWSKTLCSGNIIRGWRLRPSSSYAVRTEGRRESTWRLPSLLVLRSIPVPIPKGALVRVFIIYRFHQVRRIAS